MTRVTDLTIVESLYDIMNDPIERDEFFEYMEDCWIVERQRQERRQERRQQPYFSLLIGLLLFNILSYYKNIIEIPKIILSNIKYVFIVINDNYTRFIFSQ